MLNLFQRLVLLMYVPINILRAPSRSHFKLKSEKLICCCLRKFYVDIKFGVFGCTTLWLKCLNVCNKPILKIKT